MSIFSGLLQPQNQKSSFGKIVIMGNFSTYQQPQNRTTPLRDWLVSTIQANPHITKRELNKRCPNGSNISKTIRDAVWLKLIKRDRTGFGYLPFDFEEE